MMTPQEVASCTFAKAMMGGYNMAAVDDFLDKLTEDYTALHKENTALKAKLKVVADKLKEYRDMEDAMRAALLTSQKMASSIVAEAEQKRDAMIADAAGGAKKRLQELQEQVDREERRVKEVHNRVDEELKAEKRRLEAGQEQLRSFIRDVSAVCNNQLALLEQLPDLPAAPESQPAPKAVEDAPAAAPAIQAVPETDEEEEPAFAPLPEPDPAPAPKAEAAPAKPPKAAAPVEEEDLDIAQKLADVFSAFDAGAASSDDKDKEDDNPFADDDFSDDDDDDDDTAATRIMNLDDLQFGRNYTRD